MVENKKEKDKKGSKHEVSEEGVILEDLRAHTFLVIAKTPGEFVSCSFEFFVCISLECSLN